MRTARKTQERTAVEDGEMRTGLCEYSRKGGIGIGKEKKRGGFVDCIAILRKYSNISKILSNIVVEKWHLLRYNFDKDIYIYIGNIFFTLTRYI